MKLITWDQSFSVHIEGIDAQHQWLTDIINALYDELNENNGKKVLEIIIDSLVQYTQNHFETEEAYMIQYNYPGYIEHKLKHEEFAQRTLEWNKAIKNGQLSFTNEMLFLLKDWFEDHEINVDIPLGNFLNSKGVK
jgi:hemerythrin